MLPSDARARRLFVTTGALKKVQEIPAEPGTSMMECIAIINACFPEEIVRYYTPGYPDSLLDKVEQFVPQVDVRSVGCVGSDTGAGNIPAVPLPSETTSQELLECLPPMTT